MQITYSAQHLSRMFDIHLAQGDSRVKCHVFTAGFTAAEYIRGQNVDYTMEPMFNLDSPLSREDMSCFFEAFSPLAVQTSPATPTQTPATQTPATQTHVMPTHDDVYIRMEVDSSVTLAGAELDISATPAAGAEPVAETDVVFMPFSNLDSCNGMLYRTDPMVQTDRVSAAEDEDYARKLNVKKLRAMQLSVQKVDALLMAGEWSSHQGILPDGHASDEEDLTFKDLSTFEGVSDVSPQDDYVRQPFPVECHVPDTRPGNAAGFGEIPEAIVSSPAPRVRRTLPPDIQQYLDTIAPDDGRLVKVSSRPNASGHRVGMRLDLGLTRQMFEDDATVRSVGASRKIFCVTQVELTAQDTETRSLGPERMCCCGTWPLGENAGQGVHSVHRWRDCPRVKNQRR